MIHTQAVRLWNHPLKPTPTWVYWVETCEAAVEQTSTSYEHHCCHTVLPNTPERYKPWSQRFRSLLAGWGEAVSKPGFYSLYFIKNRNFVAIFSGKDHTEKET